MQTVRFRNRRRLSLRATYMRRRKVCGARRVIHGSRHHPVRFPSHHRLPPCFRRNQHPSYIKSFSFLLLLPPARWHRGCLQCTPTYVYIIATLCPQESQLTRSTGGLLWATQHTTKGDVATLTMKTKFLESFGCWSRRKRLSPRNGTSSNMAMKMRIEFRLMCRCTPI